MTDDAKTRSRSNACCITTQLSPWLAVGALSPRRVWRAAGAGGQKRGAAERSSIRGQLLWRESFHAVGLAGMIARAPSPKAARSVFGSTQELCSLAGKTRAGQPRFRIARFWNGRFGTRKVRGSRVAEEAAPFGPPWHASRAMQRDLEKTGLLPASAV